MKIILLKKESDLLDVLNIGLLMMSIHLTKSNIRISILLFIFVNVIEIMRKLKNNRVSVSQKKKAILDQKDEVNQSDRIRLLIGK